MLRSCCAAAVPAHQVRWDLMLLSSQEGFPLPDLP